MKLYGKYFCGNEISEYGQKHGYLDYATLAEAFDAVLNNDIIRKTADIGYWECVSGSEYDEETDTYADIYQFFIVSDNGAEILQEIDEIVYYNDTLGMYVWGVTHYGTAWSYVLTDVPCNVEYESESDNV